MSKRNKQLVILGLVSFLVGAVILFLIRPEPGTDVIGFAFFAYLTGVAITAIGVNDEIRNK